MVVDARREMLLIQSLGTPPSLLGLIKWESHIPKMIYYFMCESALKPAQDKHGQTVMTIFGTCSYICR